jgi:hypothetical protein
MKTIVIAVMMVLLCALPCQAADSGFTQGIKEIGKGIKEGAQEVGQGVKEAGKEILQKGKETGQTIKEDSKEVGQKIKEEAKEVKQGITEGIPGHLLDEGAADLAGSLHHDPLVPEQLRKHLVVERPPGFVRNRTGAVLTIRGIQQGGLVHPGQTLQQTPLPGRRFLDRLPAAGHFSPFEFSGFALPAH